MAGSPRQQLDANVRVSYRLLMATAPKNDPSRKLEQNHGRAHLDRPDKFSREQFTISDLTSEFDCTARALRFYEDEGLIAPARVGLTRVYSKRDRARLAWIMRAKNVGFSLTEIREMIDLYDLDDGRVEWRRGYNQAALLARELAKCGAGELVVDAMQRTRMTPSLGGLGRRERESALRGAIAVKPSRRETISGQHIILVDDVLTSGATTDACVIALKKSGARSVRIACFSRVLDEALHIGTVNPSGAFAADVCPTNETPEVPKGTSGAT